MPTEGIRTCGGIPRRRPRSICGSCATNGNVTDPRIEARIPPSARLVLDTSVLVAFLTATEPVSGLARTVIEEFLGRGRNEGFVSALSVGEVLVRPALTGDARGVALDILDMPGLELRSVDLLVGAEAARIRGMSRLPMPDAIVIATAVLTRSDVLVTNDRRLAGAMPEVVPDTDVVLLSDLV
ncbi:MAG: PIN domain-containing protein [Candidatus Limnocylindrales bacterium]